MSMGSSSLRAILALATLLPTRATPTASVADILDCDLYRSCCVELASLPLLCTGYSAHHSRQAAWMGCQPTHGLMDAERCMLRAVTSSVTTHISEGIAATHPLSSLSSTSEDTDLLSAVEDTAAYVGHPSALNDRRLRIRSTIVSVALRLRPLSSIIHASMPHSVRHVAGRLNVAFLSAVADSIGWPDVTLAECFRSGFPVVGWVPVSGVPSYVSVPRPVDPPDIRTLPNAAHNSHLARTVESELRGGRSRHASVLWDKTMDEVRLGVCQGPFSLSDLNSRFGPDSWRAMKRFAVEQLRPDGSTKYRPCDDAAASMHNECTSLGETITCDRADFPARVAALFYAAIGHLPGWGMKGGTDDIELAYRQCPVRTPQFVVACLADPSSGAARFFVLPGMAFGHTASVNQFNRLPELVVHFLRRRCGVVCTHYFDDYVTCEPSFAGSSGQDLLLLVHTSIGMPLSAEKHEPMSELFVFLGVLTDFTAFVARRVVAMRPKPGRLESVLKALAIIVAAGTINYGQASTLRGKLQFLLCTVGFGSRPAKSVLAAFAAVRRGGLVGRSGGRRIPLSGELRAAIHFLSTVLRFMPPRVIDLPATLRAAARGSVVIWSDAMWEDANGPSPARGGLGFVVWFPAGHSLGGKTGRFFYSDRFVGVGDLSFLSRTTSLIGQLELLAAAAVYVSFARGAFDEQDVIHFIDNSSALYGMVKGYSRVPDSLAIIRAFHAANLALRANVWFNYVASKANVADLPSRGALDEMDDCIRAVHPSFTLDDRVEFVMPACPKDLSVLWAAVMAQIPSPPAAAPSRPPRGPRAGSSSRRKRPRH